MRVNVYAEELTDEYIWTETTATTGRKQYGVRFPLKSALELHNDPDDDDRSAVTFWLPGIDPARGQAFAAALQRAAARIHELYANLALAEETSADDR